MLQIRRPGWRVDIVSEYRGERLYSYTHVSTGVTAHYVPDEQLWVLAGVHLELLHSAPTLEQLMVWAEAVVALDI